MPGISHIAQEDNAAPKKKLWGVKWHSVRKNIFTTFLKEMPCLTLAIVGATVGMGFLSHNPVIEFGIAIVGAIVGETIAHKIFKPSCHDRHNCATHAHKSWRDEMVKRYGLALLFGVLTWGVHQYVLHENNDAQAHINTVPVIESHQSHSHL